MSQEFHSLFMAMHEDLGFIKASCKNIERKLETHEQEIKSLQSFKWKSLGIWSAVSAIAVSAWEMLSHLMKQ